MLSQCTNFVSAKFKTFPWDVDADISNLPIVVLSHLERLELSYSSHSNSFHFPFFQPLALPALRVLTLCDGDVSDHSGRWSQEVFSQFLARSPNLDQLECRYIEIDMDDLISILHNAPSLNSVALMHMWVTDQVLQTLPYSDSTLSQPLLPRLVHLHLEDIGYYLDESELEATVRSRWWSDMHLSTLPAPPRVARLQTVFVSFSEFGGDQLSDMIKQRMEDCRVEGLDLDLR